MYKNKRLHIVHVMSMAFSRIPFETFMNTIFSYETFFLLPRPLVKFLRVKSHFCKDFCKVSNNPMTEVFVQRSLRRREEVALISAMFFWMLWPTVRDKFARVIQGLGEFGPSCQELSENLLQFFASSLEKNFSIYFVCPFLQLYYWC